MTLTTIRRPAEISDTNLSTLRRWNKLTTDNIDRLNSLPATGTWTPSFALTTGSVTYLRQSGFYTKLGKKVFCSGRIALSAISTPVNVAVTLSGLPFAPNTDYQGAGYSGLAYGFTFTGQLSIRVEGTNVLLTINNNGTAINFDAATMLSASTDWIFDLNYDT